ncbi:MAG: hypothetical protein H6828_06170 [Planctomycetes bacterium]|nr:hypothetical protein [Planctomycetota bacterium]
MTPDEKEARAAVDELRRRVKREEALDRFLARALLVSLGRMELEEPGSAGELAREVRETTAPVREAWEAALEAEMAMAGTEHVRSVDPRYLDQPIYDFEYTVAARERLEARFVAAGLLEYEVDEALLDRVAEADRILQPYLDAR